MITMRVVRGGVLLTVLLVLPALVPFGRSSSMPDSRSRALPDPSTVMLQGEELVYEVSWMTAKLGQIRIKTLTSKDVEGKLQHTAVSYIDSYDGLPFVDLHAINQSILDDECYALKSRTIEKRDGYWEKEDVYLDPGRRLLMTEKSRHESPKAPPMNPPVYDSIPVATDRMLDGLSIFFFARANMRAGESLAVPTIVYDKEGRTVFNFRPGTEYKEIDAVREGKIRVVPLEGTAEFEGIFGMTGDFKGWFTDDEAAIPIIGELKVLIGSVKVELIEWERDGWKPPLESSSAGDR